MQKILAGDIGGTKTVLALYEKRGDERSPLIKKQYRTDNFVTAEELLHQFLQETGEDISAISLAVAGPVSTGVVEMTNLPWRISTEQLKKEFQTPNVSLVNDLTAVCAGISVLQDEDLLTLHAGTVSIDNMQGVIAPGTGLGFGMIFKAGETLIARGTEGGHADFSPVGEEQIALLEWLRAHKKTEIFSEMVCAGPAIADLYDFCREYHCLEESTWVVEQFAHCHDRSPIIGKAAIADIHCPLCFKTIELFFKIVGGQAANLALKINAKGGIFLGGGILPRFVDKLPFDSLVEAFKSRADRAPFMIDVPIYLILRKDVALLGAARYGFAPDFISSIG